MPQRPVLRTIQVRVPPRLAVRLQKLAAVEGNHVSAIVRRLVSRALDETDAAARPVSRAAKPPLRKSA